MSAIQINELPAMTASGKCKKLAKSSPLSYQIIPVGETSFVAELATVSNHADLDHEMLGMPHSIDVGCVDMDVVMVDAPEIEVEFGVPELDSAEVFITVEDPDTVMENAPLAELEVKLEAAELHGMDIIIDYS